MPACSLPLVGVDGLVGGVLLVADHPPVLELDDDQVLAVLEKMIKQRRDSITQYENAGRQELADQEQREITIIEAYMPEGLSDEEIAALIEAAVAETGAESVRDMGKVMGLLKPKMQGRADMGKVGALVKQKLSG